MKYYVKYRLKDSCNAGSFKYIKGGSFDDLESVCRFIEWHVETKRLNSGDAVIIELYGGDVNGEKSFDAS